ncbi:MAG: J domain-containing protein [Deltaproteobacteria bacterium]|nr:J domain-containing protein [Deltaproteobacteria bacterium]
MEQDAFRARIEQIFRDLDTYTYYGLLNLAPDASVEQIRDMFHRMALSMHPDRHRGTHDPELKKMLYAVYKRISEGYRVLTDHQLRQEYQACLQRGEVRLVKTERPRMKRADDSIKNPKAKKFFNMGLDFERRGDLKNARINFKFAHDLDDEAEAIAAKLEELDAKLANALSHES